MRCTYYTDFYFGNIITNSTKLDDILMEINIKSMIFCYSALFKNKNHILRLNTLKIGKSLKFTESNFQINNFQSCPTSKSLSQI